MEQKNNKNEYLNVYISTSLGEIKEYVKNCINLDEQQATIVDQKMQAIIKELVSGISENNEKHQEAVSQLLSFLNPKEHDKVKNMLILLYTALYFDNVALLNKMLQAGVGFDIRSQYLGLFLLNNELTSQFKDDEYLEIVKKWQWQIAGFYDSTKELPLEERQKYTERVAYLLKNMPTEFEKDLPFHLFDKHALDNYEDETYLRASEKQLLAFGSAPWSYYVNKEGNREESLKRLNHLLQTTDFDKTFINFDLMFTLFSDEELLKFGWRESCFFEMLSETEELRAKAIDLYHKCPEYIGEFGWGVNPTVLRTINNDVLIEMKKNNINLGLGIDFLGPLSNLYKPKVLVRKIFNKKQGNN